MKPQRALQLAKALLEKEIQRLAFDANMHEKFKADYPHAVNSFKKRQEYQEALKVLEEMAGRL
jgi:hypothetical protein